MNNSDYCIARARIQWKEQLAKYLAMLKTLSTELGINFEILIVKKKTDNFISYSIVFEKLLKLKILIRYGYLIIIDIIYNTNHLH